MDVERRISLEHLPDIVLINILQFLNADDLENVSQYHPRVRDFCSDKLVVRSTSFEGSYGMSDKAFRNYIKRNGQYIQHLNLNHCYWLPAATVEWAINKCRDLHSLHLIECHIRPHILATQVSKLCKLKSLSFSVQSFLDLKAEKFSQCANVLANLKTIHIFYSSRPPMTMHYLGEHHTLLNYCQSLEQIYIGAVGMAVHDLYNTLIPELYRPLLAHPQHYHKLKVMSITSNVHPGAQMLFYGLLHQLPNRFISYQQLALPNVNIAEFEKKLEYKHCLRDINTLSAFDVSGSKVKYPLWLMSLKPENVLEHLSLSTLQLDSCIFHTIASCCQHLRSLNVFGCEKIFDGDPDSVGDSMAELFDNCPHLQHLNLGGVHHHRPHMSHSPATAICSKLKGLKSLCLSTCLLRGDTEDSTLKRPSQDDLAFAPTKRRRFESDSEDLLSKPSTSSQHSDLSCSASSISCSASSIPSFQPQRRAHVRYVPAQNVEPLVRNNPDLHELEVIAPELSSVIHSNKFISPRGHNSPETCDITRLVQDNCLKPLCQLTQLEKLTLMGFPGIKSMVFLVKIGQNCPNLHQLSLGYFTREAFGPIFYEALKHMQSLKDLRLESVEMNVDGRLFTAISHCRNLERLCIISKHNTSLDKEAVLQMFEKIPSLVVLHMFIHGTMTSFKTITKEISKRYSKTRPALSVVIHPLQFTTGIADACNNLPAGHYMELTRFESRVACYPLLARATVMS